ncbi:MAG: discoidin domain-containing protein [Candidatus Brocadiales bacterium]|nr:discoidin domain-containing protein [Candidatus Brocadiales bacterium]
MSNLPCLILFLVIALEMQVIAGPTKEIEIIFDSSASMEEAQEGSTKMNIAKKALISILGELPADAKVGFRAYGHRYFWKDEQKSCADTELLVPIAKADKALITLGVQNLAPRGATPIALSLQEAAKDFSGEAERFIILLSDGKETCGGDPVGVIRALRAQGINIIVHVVGFGVGGEGEKELSKIAEASGGKYYTAKSSVELAQALKTVTKEVAEPTPGEIVLPEKKKKGNLLAASEGGHMVFATKDIFNKLIDGKDDLVYWFYPGDEAVYAFEGEKTATIDKIQIPVFEAKGYNVKEVEVSVSTTSATEGFTLIGTLKPKNMVFANPYQEFKFNPVQARYIKFKPLSDFGGGAIGLYEFKVFGELMEEEAVVVAAKKEERGIDLLARANGGHFVAGTKNIFEQLNDGKEAQLYWFYNGDEGIFGFRDEKEATIYSVAVPIFEKSANNVKEIEIQVSNDLENFTPVGNIQTTNGLFAKNPYQEFRLGPVKAKYIKFKLLSDHGAGGIMLYELKVFGRLE